MSETTNDNHLDVEVISALIDGALPAQEADAADAHLASCSRCQAERAQLEQTVRAVRALPAVRPPRSFRIEAAATPTGAGTPSAWPPPQHSPMPARGSWLSPGLLRSLAGVAAGLMVVLFVADAFVPYGPPGGGRGVFATGGAALAPVGSQLQNAPEARAPASSDQPSSEAVPGPAAQRGAAAPPAARFSAPASQAADSAGSPADSIAVAPAPQGGQSTGRAAESGDAAGGGTTDTRGDAVPAAPANAPRSVDSRPTVGAVAAPADSQAAAKAGAPQAPPTVVNVVYPRGTLRPLHVGAGFGALAFALIAASMILARRRSS